MPTAKQIEKIRQWQEQDIPAKKQAKRLRMPIRTFYDIVKKYHLQKSQWRSLRLAAEIRLITEWQKQKIPLKEQADRLGTPIERVNRLIAKHKIYQKHWGKTWTAKELEQVKQWQEQGVPGDEQAKRLGRDYFSWKSAVQRHQLQVYKHGDPYNRYDVDIRATVMRLLQDKMCVTAIAKQVNKSHGRICEIVREFLKKGLVVKSKRIGGSNGVYTYTVTKAWKG